MKTIYLMAILALFVSACGLRGPGDDKLAAACGKAANTLLQDTDYHFIPKGFTGADTAEGKSYRKISISGIKTDEWFEEEISYECLFETGAANIAALIRFKGDDIMLGRNDGEIYGSMEDFMKLVTASDSVLQTH